MESSTQNHDDLLPVDTKVNLQNPDSSKADTDSLTDSELSVPESNPETSLLTLPFRPANHHSAMQESRKRPADQQQQSGREAIPKTWRYPRAKTPLPTLTHAQKTAIRVQAARDTFNVSQKILGNLTGSFGLGYKFRHQKIKSLDSVLKSSSRYPKYPTTQVKVVNKDTLDAAIALDNAADMMGIKSKMRSLVVNFATASVPGGGWLNGASAQEEQICYRTTLSYHGLSPDFYPMRSDEGIYTSNCLIMRENEQKGYSWMWLGKPELLPLTSVISVAATQSPPLDSTGTKYKNPSERTLTEDKMRSILRIAADHLHTKLVLGALGCGAFHHPPGEVADCWVKVLQEKEFKGWFEFIVFAVLDKKDGDNFLTFKKALHDLKM